MKRLLLPGLLLLLAATARGQSDGVVRLTISPARPPSPALRYPLLPELRSTTPGNAALLYYRAFSPEALTHRRPEVLKQLDAWSSNIPGKPPPELAWVQTYPPLREVDRAARRAYCDWEITERARKEGIGLLLPDVQSMREFARLLALRARFEIEAGEHDKAAITIQTGLTLSRHVADAPTLIQALVGIAIQAVMLEEVHRWIERPDTPNLYWSLTTLPSPYIDMRKPLQGERLFLESMFPGVREAVAEKKVPVVPAHAIRDLLAVAERLPRADDEVSGFGMRVVLACYAAKVYPEAKKTLHELGYKPADVEAMPVAAAAMIHEVTQYDRVYDDLIKWYGLPYWQASEGLAKVQKSIRKNVGDDTVGMVLARLLLPATDKVLLAAVRADRRIAAIRCVEALRLHAAEKGGLPAKLGDVTAVPVPIDPLTGNPFEYTVQGDKASLYGPPPAGSPGGAHNSIRYEITLRK